jgi:molecular chaperone DnaK (HSP70)
MDAKLHRVIGIDLGTTYSAVASFNTYSEQSEIINNSESDNPETTASVISLEPMLRKVIVGSAAKRNLSTDPQNTVIEIKREMGEVFRPDTIGKYGATGVFNVNDPLKVHFAGQWMLPQEISAFTLMKMKEVAERAIGQEIHDAVVTVPAYFKETQKKATEEAVLLAGLYPRQLIPEPTAAAICYGVDKMETERKTYMVYDLGGGTFDVSIIQVDAGMIDVIATSGDPRLGGSDFDDAITRWALEELLKKGIDVRKDLAACARIKDRAELTKIRLSFAERDNLDLAFLRNPAVMNLELTRDRFLELIGDLLRKSLTYVEVALNEAANKKGVERKHVDAILLVGGSSKIPKVKSLLLDYFGKDESFVRGELNPDAVVARGAALMAFRLSPTPGAFDIRRRKEATLVNTEATEIQEVRLITEHSLGIGVQDNQCVRIVEQGTNIPIEVKRGGFVNGGPIEYVTVPVFQGEGKFQYENSLIGTLQIGPMEPKPANFHQFEVTFKLDQNGLLTMLVNHLNASKTYEARFEQKTGVGGDEAMMAMRNKLLGMFAHTAAMPPQALPTSAASAPQSVPPPPPPPPPPAPATVAPAMPSTPSQPTQTPSAGGAAVAPLPAASPLGLTEPTRPVPEQFKQVVRRVQKQLIRQPDPDLLKTWSAFVTALNAGQPESTLEELGDELADAFDRTRK